MLTSGDAGQPNKRRHDAERPACRPVAIAGVSGRRRRRRLCRASSSCLACLIVVPGSCATIRWQLERQDISGRYFTSSSCDESRVETRCSATTTRSSSFVSISLERQQILLAEAHTCRDCGFFAARWRPRRRIANRWPRACLRCLLEGACARASQRQSLMR